MHSLPLIIQELAHTEPGQQNQTDPDQHPPPSTRDTIDPRSRLFNNLMPTLVPVRPEQKKRANIHLRQFETTSQHHDNDPVPVQTLETCGYRRSH